MTKKRCTKCDTEKNLSEFRKDSRRSDERQSWCRFCMRLHQTSVYSTKYGGKARSRNSIRAREMCERFNEYKSALKCTACGETTGVCLDFHHKDPSEKDFRMSSFGTRSWELIKAEMDKCVVLCKNCHAKVHHGLLKI